jgi:hypothetical protein
MSLFIVLLCFIIAPAIYFTILIDKYHRENHTINAYVVQSNLNQNTQYIVNSCNPCLTDYDLPYCNELIQNKTTGKCQSNTPAICRNNQNLNPVCLIIETKYYNPKVIVEYTKNGVQYQRNLPDYCDRYDINCNVDFIIMNPIGKSVRMCYRNNNPNNSHFNLEKCPSRLAAYCYFLMFFGYIFGLFMLYVIIIIIYDSIINCIKYGKFLSPRPPKPNSTDSELNSVTTDTLGNLFYITNDDVTTNSVSTA